MDSQVRPSADPACVKSTDAEWVHGQGGVVKLVQLVPQYSLNHMQPGCPTMIPNDFRKTMEWYEMQDG